MLITLSPVTTRLGSMDFTVPDTVQNTDADTKPPLPLSSALPAHGPPLPRLAWRARRYAGTTDTPDLPLAKLLSWLILGQVFSVVWMDAAHKC